MKTKVSIKLDCEEWHLADALHDIANSIENCDLLDRTNNGVVKTFGLNYDAKITIK